ncbi:MAG: hypothetical protein QXR84_04890 [Candidatus Bathyarchaeia archaeon]
MSYRCLKDEENIIKGRSIHNNAEDYYENIIYVAHRIILCGKTGR